MEGDWTDGAEDGRKLLAEYTGGAAGVDALRSLALAAERTCALGAPRAAIVLRGGAKLNLPELRSPCFGSSALSVWLWVCLDDMPVDSPLNVLCALQGSGTSFEVVVRGGGFFGVRVVTPKGGVQMLEALSPLESGRWHILIVDHTAPPRRLFNFGRSPSCGTVRLFVDGACVLEGPLEFPSPTRALRHCSVRAPASMAAPTGPSIPSTARGPKTSSRLPVATAPIPESNCAIPNVMPSVLADTP
jgi:hypothetical protein